MVERLDDIAPEVLSWARSTARLSQEEAAKRAGITLSSLQKMESGEHGPTMNQLRHLATAYNRPLGALFLNEPPLEEGSVRVPDFRRAENRGNESASLRRSILRAVNRLEVVDELFDEGVETGFEQSTLSLSLKTPPEQAAAQIREEFSLETIEKSRDGEAMLSLLIERLNSKAYLVMQSERVEYGEMRGYSLRGTHASIIVINGKDYPRGKIFTLIHEVVHIALKNSALCDLSRTSDLAEERYCDQVASAALAPKSAVDAAAPEINIEDPGSLRSSARAISPGLSAEALTLRLVELGYATWNDYNALRPEFHKAYERYRADLKPKDDGPAPPIYYPMKVKSLGKPFIGLVVQAHQDGLVSSRDTAELLDIQYSNLGKLINQASYGRVKP